jgi:hypothetical protein
MSCTRVHILSLLSLLAAASLAGQFALRGTISGTVTDASGAVVPSVRVVLLEPSRNQQQETSTNESGIYTFSNLTQGAYQVAVEQPGFKRSLSPAVDVGTQGSYRLDLVIEVGDVTTTVEVMDASPVLRTDQAVVGQTVERELVETLPMKGRNFTGFAALAPNISSFPRGNSGGNWSAGGHHMIGGTDYIAGGGGDNGFYMNGVNINDNWVGSTSYAPSMEAISEVKIDVANFSAANGRDIATFQVSTRGGSNTLHGTGYDYFQNSALNAWNPYTRMQISPDQKKDVLQRNQFGGNLGGPVFIPKFWDGRNKAFFFVNFEQTIENRGGGSAIYRVPTAAERQGDFSHLLQRFPGDPNYVLYDPFSTIIDEDGESFRTPLSNNTIPSAQLNADAQAMLAMFPETNGYTNPSDPRDLRNFRTFARNGQNNYRTDMRFDYRITGNDNVFVNVSRSRGRDNNTGGLFPELRANIQDSSYVVTTNYARVFTPSLTNEFVFGFGKGRLDNVDSRVQSYMREEGTLRNRFFQNIGSGADRGFHVIGFWNSGWSSIGHEEVFFASNPSLQFSDNVSWIRNNHTFKFGFNYFQKKEVDNDYIRGVYFSKQFTQAGSLDEQRGGDALGDFLYGLPVAMQQRFAFEGGDPELNFVMPYWGFYAEDRWQATRNLTISLGLRYDLAIPTYSGARYGSARVNFDVPGWQLEIPGRADGVPLHWIPADKNNFAPRISLAYKAPGETVFRASYGIFYMAGTTMGGGSRLDHAFGSVPGYVGDWFDNARFGVPDDIPTLRFADIFPMQNTFKVGQYPISTGTGTGYFDYPADISTSDRDSRTTPYYQRYLFEVQKALSPTTVISATYMGGRGTKLPFYENVNRPAYRTGWTSEDTYNDARPNNTGRFADVRLLRPGLNTFYNAATIKFDRRFSRGLQLMAHFTFSKTVADYTELTPESLPVTRLFWQWNRNLGRGESDYSHPQRLVVSGTYGVPFTATQNRFAQAIAGGWNLSGIYTYESGNALTVYNDVTDARDFEPNMPLISGNPNLPGGDRTFSRWFDTSVFSAPPQDVKGNAGPGIVRGPGLNNFDISLSKDFRPLERLTLQFRGDLLNALNHTQWSGVNTTFSDSAGTRFGWITGAREGRVVQLGLRVSF